MGTLRTPAMTAAYAEAQARGILSEGCALCKKKSLKEFKEWRIIDNEFPYDLIAAVHHMIVPKRHVPDAGLTDSEKEEFASIKQTYLEDTYEFLIEPVVRRKTIPEHSHLHAIVAKD